MRLGTGRIGLRCEAKNRAKCVPVAAVGACYDGWVIDPVVFGLRD
jgi:hypothetical protein